MTLCVIQEIQLSLSISKLNLNNYKALEKAITN